MQRDRMIDITKQILVSQFDAALAMLDACIEKCVVC